MSATRNTLLLAGLACSCTFCGEGAEAFSSTDSTARPRYQPTNIALEALAPRIATQPRLLLARVEKRRSAKGVAAQVAAEIQAAIDAGLITPAEVVAANGDLRRIRAIIQARLNQMQVQEAVDNGLVRAEDVARLRGDRKKIKDLIDLKAGSELTGDDGTSYEKARDTYLKNPTKKGLRDANLVLAADALGADAEQAKDSGVTSAQQLMDLAANLSLVGDANVAARMKTAKLWKEVKQKGTDGVVRDTLADNMRIPPGAIKGIGLKSVLNGVTAAQELGLDATNPTVWEKIKTEGVAGLYKDKFVASKKIPAEAVEGLTLQEVKEGVKQAGGDKNKITDPNYWKEFKGKLGKAKSDAAAKAGAGGDTQGKSPFLKPGGVFVGEILSGRVRGKSPKTGSNSDTSNNPTNTPATKTGTTPNTSAGNSAVRIGAGVGELLVGGRGCNGNGGGNGASGDNATNSGGNNSSSGAGDTAAEGPTSAGGSQSGGSFNPSGDDAPSATTGSGFSSADGTEAGPGGVYTVIGAEGDDDTVSYTWTASGTNGQDGIYVTTYTKNADGSWSWTVEKALTGEKVNEGSGAPPDPSIVGTSTQDTDGDEMIFPTAEDGEAGTEGGTDGQDTTNDGSGDDSDDDDDDDKGGDSTTTDTATDTGTDNGGDTGGNDSTAGSSDESTPNPDAPGRFDPGKNASLPGGKQAQDRQNKAIDQQRSGGHTDPVEGEGGPLDMGIMYLGLQMLLGNQQKRQTETALGAANGSHVGAPDRRRRAYQPSKQELEDILIRTGGGVTTPPQDSGNGGGKPVAGQPLAGPIFGGPIPKGARRALDSIKINVAINASQVVRESGR